MLAPMFEQLDFLYIPSTDVAGDAKYFTEVLGGRLAFAIDDDGTRVAMVEMTEGPPALLFTDHLEGDRTIFIYRVANLRKSLRSSPGAAGSRKKRSRSRRGRAARSSHRKASGSRSTNGRDPTWNRTSSGAGTSEANRRSV